MDMREMKMLAGMNDHNGDGYIAEQSDMRDPSNKVYGQKLIESGLKSMKKVWKSDQAAGIGAILVGLHNASSKSLDNKDLAKKCWKLSEEFYALSKEFSKKEG